MKSTREFTTFPDGRFFTFEYIYDESGRPLQMIFDNGAGFNQVYNYVLSLQGDVQEIRCAASGAVVARYLYNAWGYLIEAYGWMAEFNPLRYRGKYYESALGMYYLQTRFYDPWIGRFLNADEFVSTGQGLLGFNMFAYCLNNPVNMVDQDGRIWDFY